MHGNVSILYVPILFAAKADSFHIAATIFLYAPVNSQMMIHCRSSALEQMSRSEGVMYPYLNKCKRRNIVIIV
jgi:hypothetical protein